MVTARSLPLPLPPTALPCLRALPHPGQGLGAPDGSGSPAMQDPATAALRGVPRPLLGSSPTHKPAAAPTSCPVSRTRSPGLRSSSPRQRRLPLCPPGGTRAQIPAPKAAGPLAAISCCLGLRMNSQGGRGGTCPWGAAAAQLLRRAFAVPKSWIWPPCWSSDRQSR